MKVDQIATAVGGTAFRWGMLESVHMKNRASASISARDIVRPSRLLTYAGCAALAVVAMAATNSLQGTPGAGNFLAAAITPGPSGSTIAAASLAQSTQVMPATTTISPTVNIEDNAPFTIEELPVEREEIQWFNGRPLRAVKTLRMKVTAYSPDERSCGIWADGITASGYSVFTNGGKLVAADTSLLPFGSLISIPGYDNGAPVPVLDRGGAIKGNRLDVLYPTHRRALQWGVQELEVTVWEYADGQPNDFRQQH